MNRKLLLYGAIIFLVLYEHVSCMQENLLPGVNSEPQHVGCQYCVARYTLHFLYLATITTAVIGGLFLGSSVKNKLQLMEDNCRSMRDTCDDCSDTVAAIKPYVEALANFTQGCPTAMKGFAAATYLSMMNCREENKCEPAEKVVKNHNG